MKRATSTPPDLRGYEHVRWLGGGGFADVFLYQQRRPIREVAIKVLRNSVFDADVQEQFEAEANLMAAVSEHPYIVAIYGADIAPDGRPYLAMEYYAHGHYNDRARNGGVSIEEALRVGIQVASAVETAHEAGIIHNDIKPSNILLNRYGRPGLTDFGISVEARQVDGRGARGASLPYTAPEILEQQLHGSRASDVFALGATIYALVAGHSPFERPGGGNDSVDVVERVLRESPPPIRRNGVPESLERLLQQALAKDARLRPQTARALAVALQAIEVELGFAMTPLALGSEPTAETTPSSTEVDKERTTYRPVVVNPDGHVRTEPAARHEPLERPGPTPAPPEPDRVDHAQMPRFVDTDPPALDAPVLGDVTMARRRDADVVDPPTVGRIPAERSGATDVATPEEESGLSRRWVALAAGLCALVAIGVAAVLLTGRGDESRPPPDDGASGEETTVGEATGFDLVLPPSDVTGTTDAQGVVFTWTPPAGGPVDHYRVTRLDDLLGPKVEQVTEPRYASWDEQLCIQVATVRDGRLSQPSAAVCAP